MGPDDRTIVVQHEAVPDYMPAMTMPFHVRQSGEIAGLRAGDGVSFQLHISDQSSWIDHITSTLNNASLQPAPTPVQPAQPSSANLAAIPNFALTNEFGERISFQQFRGQAIALSFFFTRCPIPDYCPRVSKSLAEASRILSEPTSTCTNWHLISVSFDPSDRPEVLRAYGLRYQYDPTHWTFVTGDPADIRVLTAGFGLKVSAEGGTFNHDFRTIIFDANGDFQTMWPFGGDTTQLLVSELTKAAAVKCVRRDPAGKPAGGS